MLGTIEREARAFLRICEHEGMTFFANNDYLRLKRKREEKAEQAIAEVRKYADTTLVTVFFFSFFFHERAIVHKGVEKSYNSFNNAEITRWLFDVFKCKNNHFLSFSSNRIDFPIVISLAMRKEYFVQTLPENILFFSTVINLKERNTILLRPITLSR